MNNQVMIIKPQVFTVHTFRWKIMTNKLVLQIVNFAKELSHIQVEILHSHAYKYT